MMDPLKITSLRPGRNGSNPQATNYANYEESRANRFPDLPDPLVPVDSYELVGPCAPRPVFLSAGATRGDGWVDAKGTFLAGLGAGPVYQLLGKKGMSITEFPDIESLADGDVAFRQHSGGHTDAPNWPVFLKFADRYIGIKGTSQ